MASSNQWSPEDIRKNAHSWTLEGDAKLLELMQSISQNLETRTKQTKSNFNRLVLDIDRTNVSLGNVTNQLSALQHSQFVENRVYEDDETIANVSEVPINVQIENEYDPIKTLNIVLKNSVTMLENCYEKVSVEIEDSDDEGETSKSVVYRPKNPYDCRPLPYLIGSKEWIEKWHIGLCDSDEDISEDENPDEYSESSDENPSLSASIPSNAPTISESEFSVWGLNANADNKRPTGIFPSSDDISSNTLPSKASSMEDKNLNGQRIVPSHFPIIPTEERYYVHKPKERGLFDESSDESEHDVFKDIKSDTSKVVQTNPVVSKVSNIFNDEPPDLDVIDRNDKEPVNLFYDSDEEDSKVNEKINPEEKPIVKEESNFRKKTVNLFDDDDFDSLMKELNTKTSNKNLENKKVRNLFDESSDDEEVEASRRIIEPVPPKPLERKHSLLAKQNDIVEEVIKPKPKMNLFADEPPDDDFDSFLPQLNKRSIDTIKTVSTKKPFTNLFDDEPPDDDFDSLFSKTEKLNVQEKQTNIPIPKARTAIPKLSGAKLFAEESDDSDLFSNNVNTAQEIPKDKPKEIIDDSFSSQHLKFAPNAEKSSGQVQPTEVNSAVNTKLPKLFSDDPPSDIEDDLFAPKSVKVLKNVDENLTSGGVKAESYKDKLFTDEFVDDNILFGSKPVQTLVNTDHTTEAEQNKEKNDNVKAQFNSIVQTKLPNLFSNEVPSDTEDDLFATKPVLTSVDDNRTKAAEAEQIFEKQSQLFEEDLLDEDKIEINPPVEVKFPNLFSNDPPSDIEDDLFASKSEKEKPLESISNELLNDKSSFASHSVESHKSENVEKVVDNVEEVEKVILAEDCVEENVDLTEKEDLESKLIPEDNKVKKDQQDILQQNDDAEYTKEKDILKNSLENLTDPAKLDLKIQKDDIFAASLFSSIPPDDTYENDTKEQDIIDDNSLFSVPEKTGNTTPNSQSYNAISLFHDIPPDDDFVSTTETKKLHNIFYDDFSETIIPPKVLLPQSNFIFSDEPPPDSFSTEKQPNIQIQTDKTQMEINTEPEKLPPPQPEIIDAPKKISALIDKVNKEATKQDAIKQKPTPKRLNSNLNINVAALLPGAKRPSIKLIEPSVSVEKISETSPKSTDVKDVVDNTPKNVQIESDPNKLQSLNKTRPKIQLKRRPSTRQARRESYIRTLSLDENNQNDDNSNTNDKQQIEQTNQTTIQQTIHKNDKTIEIVEATADDDNDDDDDWLVSATKSHTEEELPKLPINDSKNSKKSDFFDDEDDNEQNNDIFASSDKNTLKKNKEEYKEKSVIQTHEEPNLFKNTTTTPVDLFASGDHQSLNSPSIPTKENVISESKKLNEKLITNDSSPPSDTVRPQNPEKNIESKLFLEDDNDSNDDLFTPQRINISKEKNIKALSTTITQSTSTAGQKKSIFEDRSDDDEMFVNANENKTKSSETNVQVKPIFGSDDDDDDDLFGNSLKQNKPKESEVIKVKKTTFSATSIFDDADDDDDDDLFGGASVKSNKNSTISAPKKTETKKITSSKGFSDNPLADLLKE